MGEKYPFKNLKVLETKFFEIHQDWEVPISGFFIISPKRKLNTIADFTEKEAEEFIVVLCKLRKDMKTKLAINTVYLFENEDTTHNFHFWIFPRHSWMERFGRKIESVRPIMEYAKKNMMNEENILIVKEYVKKMKI